MSGDRRSVWRWVPWRTILVGTALYVACEVWVFDTCRVSTGSMEPYLHGHPDEGDCVLIDKTSTWRTDGPDRFDAVVVEIGSPEGDEYFVKRAVAFGGEEITIRGGDLFIAPEAGAESTRVRKEFTTFRPFLVDLVHEVFDDGEIPASLSVPEMAGRMDGGDLVLSGNELFSIDRACHVRETMHSGRRERDGTVRRGAHTVGDLLVELTLTPSTSDASVVVELIEGHDSFLFTIGGASKPQVVVRHTGQDEESFVAEFGGWSSGRSSCVEVWNIDGRVGVAVDGRVLLQEIHEPAKEVVGAPGFGPRFGAENGEVRLHTLRVRRDVYYVPGDDETPTRVPEGHLFLLGDASEESRDSRQFGCIPLARLVGRAVAVVRPWSRARWLR